MVEGLPPVEAGLWMMPYAAGALLVYWRADVSTKVSLITSHRLRFIDFISRLSHGHMDRYVMGNVNPHPRRCSSADGSGSSSSLKHGPNYRISTAREGGAASSLSETSGELGMALGIAVMGSIGTVIYRNRMDVPDGIPNEAAESASDTLVAL